MTPASNASPMNPVRWQRVQEIFLTALELPDETRRDYLEQNCNSNRGEADAELRAEIESLLASHFRAEESHSMVSPFEDLAPAAPAPRISERIGPWQPGRLLDSGGMGAVYEAERADGSYAKRVALKLVHPGLGESFGARFRHERAILARLDHPGIARLLDGGVAPDGRPFLVMERVDGQTITRYAAEHSLPVAERLQLFLQACDAVAYAHQALVVHRDLKPGHIVVESTDDGAPRVKLLDFGLAKLLDDDSDSALTRSGPGPLTLRYSAPEQLDGEPVTTATDVYSLGVVLYELLTESRAYDLAGLSLTLARNIISTATPDRPSEVAPAELRKSLRGDIDTVVLKALEKEPGQRYPSAAALADDIRNSLSGRPIEARPPTTGYRTRKFIRRNRVPVAAAAAAAMALLVGFGTATWQAVEADRAREQAETRFEIAQDAARALLYSVHDAIAGLPGSTPARELIVIHSLEYLDRLTEDAESDVALRLDLADAYFRIGNVQGNPTNNNLGRPEDAIASYRRGLGLLARDQGISTEHLVRLLNVRGRLSEKLGVVVAHSESAHEALPYLRQAIKAQEEAASLVPDDAFTATLLATAHINLADYLGHPYFPNAGRALEAVAHYRIAETILEPLVNEQASLFAMRMYGVTFERRGSLYREAGEYGPATAFTRQALGVRQNIAARPDADVEAIRDVGVSYEQLGLIYSEQGDLPNATRLLEEAARISERLAEADPDSFLALETLSIIDRQLGNVYAQAGRRAEARRHLSRSVLTLERLSTRAAENPRVLSQLEASREALRAAGL